jgi:hypothetical protein
MNDRPFVGSVRITAQYLGNPLERRIKSQPSQVVSGTLTHLSTESVKNRTNHGRQTAGGHTGQMAWAGAVQAQSCQQTKLLPATPSTPIEN